jgi:hypothetical protein
VYSESLTKGAAYQPTADCLVSPHLWTIAAAWKERLHASPHIRLVVMYVSRVLAFQSLNVS